MSTFTKELATTEALLQEASDISLSFFTKNPSSRLKADNSIVTEADEAIELFLKEKLAQAFPTYGFLGEETEEEIKDISWIIDPIDGTSSFARGLPDFSVVMALSVENEVVFSYVYLPFYKTLYRAEKGKGAFRNDERLFVSEVTDLSQAIISLDRKALFDDRFRNHFQPLLEKYKVRAGDHSGMGSAYLAQGSFDVLIKPTQKIWDIAPEYLLMSEAGAVVTDEYGEPLLLTFTKDARMTYFALTPTISSLYKDLLYYKKVSQ